MEWQLFIADFFAGAFLTNAIPHFTHGVAGNKFPTPFGKPPGKGLSSPTVNVLWALFNILVGYVLFRAGHISTDNIPALVVFFIGVAVFSIFPSIHFQKKDKE